jgi:ribosomal protein S18 acetylase RimI-like enzyme
LLDKVELVAKKTGADRIALQVAEINQVAVSIYQMNGYFELARRPYVSFPGSDDSGDYILMCKQLI